tara:strand:- start:72 stop:287 length:216 start_codon:yes stop_codon:yes gene_type:complete
MRVGDLVKFKDESLHYVLGISEAERFKGKIGVIIEAKTSHSYPNATTLFRIYIDGKNMEWFANDELEVVCK